MAANTMFRDFSFDPVSQPVFHAYEAERAAMNVSPTSRPTESSRYLHSRPPTPPCTIGDLAVKLNQQNLRIDTRKTTCPAAPLTPPSDSPKDNDSDRPPTYSRLSASIMRMQRQQNSRMHCSSAHVRDISKLVKMIEDEEQCTVNTSTTQTSPVPISPALSPVNSSGDDEGIDMDYDIPSQTFEAFVGMPVWRSGERRHSCIRVTKPVRMRKRSKESVGSSSKRELV